MNQHSKYKWFTKIDLSMFFYCFELDEESKEICTINTPFGLYCYTRLGMGIKVSPDIAQSVINKILDGLDTEGYIDNCGYWSDGSFDDYLDQVDKILTSLDDNGMKCNPLKCDWMVQETDFLGQWMTPTHIKPMKKKIDTILQMDCPTTTTQVCLFIGAVNFYKSLFPQSMHLLLSLTELTRNVPFSWNDEKECAFHAMKAIISLD